MSLVQVRMDDVDGSDDDVKPEVIGWRGTLYTLDLGEANRRRLDALLEEFLQVAYVFGELPTPPENPETLVKASSLAPTAAPRANGASFAEHAEAKVQRTGRRRQNDGSLPSKKSSPKKGAAAKVGSSAGLVIPPSAREIRQWGNANGFTVSPTGQIPRSVREAFAAAHGS